MADVLDRHLPGGRVVQVEFVGRRGRHVKVEANLVPEGMSLPPKDSSPVRSSTVSLEPGAGASRIITLGPTWEKSGLSVALGLSEVGSGSVTDRPLTLAPDSAPPSSMDGPGCLTLVTDEKDAKGRPLMGIAVRWGEWSLSENAPTWRMPELPNP
jgi:hypothetical protein